MSEKKVMTLDSSSLEELIGLLDLSLHKLFPAIENSVKQMESLNLESGVAQMVENCALTKMNEQWKLFAIDTKLNKLEIMFEGLDRLGGNTIMALENKQKEYLKIDVKNSEKVEKTLLEFKSISTTILKNIKDERSSFIEEFKKSKIDEEKILRQIGDLKLEVSKISSANIKAVEACNQEFLEKFKEESKKREGVRWSTIIVVVVAVVLAVSSNSLLGKFLHF